MDKNIKFFTGPTAKFKPKFYGNFLKNQAKERSLKKNSKLASKKGKIKSFKIY